VHTMRDPKDSESERSRQFVYRGTLPPALALLLIFPFLFLFLSFAAVALVGGAAAALFLPLVFGRRRRTPQQDPDCITLEQDQYSRVDPDARRLPPV